MARGNKGKISRVHHYVPQFYLAGFTNTVTKDGDLYVHDLQRLKTWRSNPRGTGNEKNFYRTDLPGHRPDEIEEILGLVETAAADVIRKIVASNPIDGKDFSRLMDFVALMMIRVPGFREAVAEADKARAREILRHLVSRPLEEQAAIMEEIRKENPDCPDVDPEFFKSFIESDEYFIEVPQNWHMKSFVVKSLSNVPDIASELMRRHWVLNVTQPNAGNFICTDNPVVVDWMYNPRASRPPGLIHPGSVVCMPLSHNLALTGTFERPPKYKFHCNKRGVAFINFILLKQTKRFVYTPDDEITWLKPNKTVGSKKNWFEYVEKLKKLRGET